MEEQQNIKHLIENYSKQADIDSDSAWNRLHRRIKRNKNRQLVLNVTRNVAAVLLPLFLIFQYLINPAIQNSKAEKEMITLVAAPGMVISTILPDGSKVWLNSQSAISYPQVFKKKERNVELTGEAYFNVKSTSEKRFNVLLSNGLKISAYGTEFNINSYKEDKTAEITLASGNVEIIDREHKIDLNVDEKAVFDKITQIIKTVNTDTYVDTAWKDGRMVFRRAKLDLIAARLEKKFGVDIHLNSEKLKEYEYTATFTDETLEDILDLLSMSAPIQYTIKKQKQLDNKTYSHREVLITIKQ